ncbi:MAG: MFS transporter, partial [Candidatus Bathyarchaeota archaeon]|nr:MFS transporter [Candidatus Bathyarchaeota archaeon]
MSGDKKSVFYALGASTATGGAPVVILSLILIDIAESLDVPVGILGQISSFSSFISIIVAVLMGVLAVRYSHKTLLMVGLALMSISIIGTSLSTSFTMILLLYSLSGIGYSMVQPMANTFVGDLYPPEGRTKIMGQMIAVRSILSFMAPLVTGYIVARSSWRLGFASYNLTLTLISLALVWKAIPRDKVEPVSGGAQLEGIRSVLRNRSATAYLIAGALALAPFMAISVFNGSYLRQHYMLSVETSSQLMPIVAIAVTGGLLTSNYFVTRLGLKRVVYLSTLFSSIAFLVYFGAGLSLVPAVVFSAIGSFLTGIWLATSGALGLIQEKTYRGSMMSLGTASFNLGGVIGALVGGVSLLRWGYLGLGAVMGALGVL